MEVETQRKNNQPTLPSLLATEKELNPFLRCKHAEIIDAVQRHTGKLLSDPIEVFAKLREWKNSF